MNIMDKLKNDRKAVDEFVTDKSMPPLYNFLHFIDEKLSELAYLEYVKLRAEKNDEYDISSLEIFLDAFNDVISSSKEILGNQSSYRAFNNYTLRGISIKRPVSYKQCRFYISDKVKEIYKYIDIFLNNKNKNGLDKLDNGEDIEYRIKRLIVLTSEDRISKRLLGKALEFPMGYVVESGGTRVFEKDFVITDENPINILKKVQHTSLDWIIKLFDVALDETEKEVKDIISSRKRNKVLEYVKIYNDMVSQGKYFAHRDHTYIYADDNRSYKRDKEMIWHDKKSIEDGNKACANDTKNNFIEEYNIPKEYWDSMLDVKKFRISKKK